MPTGSANRRTSSAYGVATASEAGNPLFTHVLFGVYIGVLMWGGLVLRQPALRAWLPLQS